MAVIADLLAERQSRRASLAGLSRPVGATAQSGAVPGGDSHWPLVLVVDDSPTIRKIVELTLRREGIRVHGVGDGLSALAAIADHKPALILLDITLPGMDGYQICQVIRQRPEGRNVPVVMLSGRDGFFDRMRGRLVGCTQYVTKPFDPTQLMKTVEKHVAHARVTPMPAASSAPDTALRSILLR